MDESFGHCRPTIGPRPAFGPHQEQLACHFVFGMRVKIEALVRATNCAGPGGLKEDRAPKLIVTIRVA